MSLICLNRVLLIIIASLASISFSMNNSSDRFSKNENTEHRPKTLVWEFLSTQDKYWFLQGSGLSAYAYPRFQQNLSAIDPSFSRSETHCCLNIGLDILKHIVEESQVSIDSPDENPDSVGQNQ